MSTVARPASKRSAQTTRPPRRRKMSAYKTFRLHAPIKHPGPALPNSFLLFLNALRHLVRHWRLFGGITLVYFVLEFIFVKGFGDSINLAGLQHTMEQLGSGMSAWSTTFPLFSYLLSTTASTGSQTTGVYETVFTIIVSLAFIWALRRTYDTTKGRIRIRDAYYTGMHPLVPYVLVLAVVGIQLLPLLLGGTLFSIVVGSGLATNSFEVFLTACISLMLAILSLYMVTSSLMATYIVTLPNMTPMKALRSARALVRYRRWSILRKLLFLPIALVVIAAGIFLPLIALVPVVVDWGYFIYTVACIAVIQGYVYGIYRELL